MPKRNRSRKRKTQTQVSKQTQATKQPRMTKEKIAEVKTWLERMGVNISRAINLSNSMSPADLVV